MFLGQANRNGSIIPLLIKGNLTNVHCVQVACGSSHTMILTDMVTNVHTLSDKTKSTIRDKFL